MSDQKLKYLFLSNLLAWVRTYIRKGSIPLIDLVDWLGTCSVKEREGEFFFFVLSFVA